MPWLVLQPNTGTHRNSNLWHPCTFPDACSLDNPNDIAHSSANSPDNCSHAITHWSTHNCTPHIATNVGTN